MTESKLIDIETDFAILRQRERPSKSESPPSESSSSEEDDEEEEEEEDKDTESTTSTRSEPGETDGVADGAKDDSDVGMEDLSVAKMNGESYRLKTVLWSFHHKKNYYYIKKITFLKCPFILVLNYNTMDFATLAWMAV